MDSIKLKNFKLFKEETEFALAPITVLTGKNSSGKSTLIKGVLLLNDLINQKDQTSLNLNGFSAHKHRIASLNEIFFNGENSDISKSFSLSFRVQNWDYSFVFTPHELPLNAQVKTFKVRSLVSENSLELLFTPDGIRVRTDLYFLEEVAGSRQYLSGSLFNADVKEIAKDDAAEISRELKVLKDKKKQQLDQNQLLDLINQEQELTKRLKLLKETKKQSARQRKSVEVNELIEYESLGIAKTFTSISREAIYAFTDGEKGSSRRVIWSRFTRGVVESIQQFYFMVYHLGPNRTHQSRLYTNKNNSSEINQIVSDLSSAPFESGSSADSFLEKWMKIFNIGEDLLIKPVENVATSLYVQNGSQVQNLSELGFGIGQVLCVLLKLAQVINDYEVNTGTKKAIPFLIIVEEPESNLHPKFQSLLADLFLDFKSHFRSKKNVRIILETHSEYLLRRLQLLVARADLRPEEVLIHYLDFDLTEKEINNNSKKIRIEEDGKLSDGFGNGFIDEADQIATDLYLEQLKKKKK